MHLINFPHTTSPIWIKRILVTGIMSGLLLIKCCKSSISQKINTFDTSADILWNLSSGSVFFLSKEYFHLWISAGNSSSLFMQIFCLSFMSAREKGPVLPLHCPSWGGSLCAASLQDSTIFSIEKGSTGNINWEMYWTPKFQIRFKF